MFSAKNRLILLYFIYISLTSSIHCDIPVNCKIEEVVGTWDFYISSTHFNPVINKKITVCGHNYPNLIEDKTKEEVESSIKKIVKNPSKITLNLLPDFQVSEGEEIVGKWTVVYDQNLYLTYKGGNFIAPFNYYVKDIQENDDDKPYVSDCHSTYTGWYVPDEKYPNKKWSCFSASKVDNENSLFLQVAHEKKGVEENNKENKKLNDLIFKVKYDEIENIINEINNANLSWNAKMYDEYKGLSLYEVSKKLGLIKGKNKKLVDNLYKEYLKKQESGVELNDDEEQRYKLFINEIESKKQNERVSEKKTEQKQYQHSFIQKKLQKISKVFSSAKSLLKSTLEQIFEANRKLKSKESKTKKNKSIVEHEPDSHFVTSPSEIQKYINSSLDEIDENTLPLNWDWRDVGGESFVGDQLTQGSCGSCYLLASIASLESRLRVQTMNKDKTEFSTQFPLSCSFYSEGCEGGLPFQVGKFSKEFELVPEECFPYREESSDCKLVCDYENYPKKYFVTDYYYLGDHYGALNEVLMMKEIRARGPIPGSLKVPYDFMSYNNGIYSCKGIQENAGKLNKKTMLDNKLTYELVEHTILLVGYGEENGVKYWIGLNSWGKNWGENGFFKILRGNDDCNIESLGEVLNIGFMDREKSKK